MDQKRARVSLGSLTDVGKRRSNNQDAYCALMGANAPDGADALVAVADGMGGHQAGEVASSMSIQGLVERLGPGGVDGEVIHTADRIDNLLAKVVRGLNEEVYSGAQRPQTQGMGTTITLGLLVGEGLYLAHVGDSRAYLLRGSRLTQLTKDHSWVAEEVARGAMSAEEAVDHPRRNIVTRALGIEPQVDVDTVALEVDEGDTFLLCSDGLHGVVSDQEIANVLSSNDPRKASELLVEMANSYGGPDNVTVVVLRVDGLEVGDGSRERLRAQQTLKLKRVGEAGLMRRMISRLVGRRGARR